MTPAEFDQFAFAERVQSILEIQPFMLLLGVELDRVGAGECEMSVPFRSELTQQNGFFHAGVTSTLADNACGCAAYTLMPEAAGVLTVEYKINLMAPAIGDRLAARAKVLRNGRQLKIVECGVYALKDEQEKQVAAALATIITLEDDAKIPNAT